MMVRLIWDLEDDPQGNFQHIAEHDVTPEEVEEILNDRHSQTAYSESSGRPITFGWTADGRYLAVIWELVDEDPRIVYPVTAYEAPEPGRER
ncbi:MAG: BrnT family toxin [Planctomycetota bacterium]|nr:BrnT family toxin [Planctomycetota bacterium]